MTTSAALAVACARRGHLSPAPGPQHGIAFDGFRARPTHEDFAALRSLGATHVALFPFGFMRRHTEPAVYRYRSRRSDWSLRDEGLLTTGRMARGAGLRIIVVPTLADFTDRHWRGEVRMEDEGSWNAWFDSYRRFLLHYAELAERMRATGFSVGTELRETVTRVTDWRKTIGLVRQKFRGWLTYAANWDDYDSVPWWDAVDLVGIQAYFELGDPGTDDLPVRTTRLVQAWAPIKQRLAVFSQATGKRVLFTEIGYKSHAGATEHPWKWQLEGLPDPALQAAAYEAAFDTFWGEPWFAGFYWWKWRASAARDLNSSRDFTPQGKPAEAVIRKYYSDIPLLRR